MGLVWLIAGLLLFGGGHLISAAAELRARIIGAFGERAYKLLYSIIAAFGIILMAYGFARYRAEGWIDVWYPPAAMRHVSALLVLIATILVVAAYVRGHIWRRLRHPMLAGIKLWALAHLLANGDLGSIILFGGLLAWAVVDRVSLKSRARPSGPSILAGGALNDVIAIVIGIVLYLLLAFVFHPAVIGVPVFGS